MRDLKFRAWDARNKKMCFDDDEMDSPGFHIGHFGCFNDDQYIFMQYTGLKDKNGVDIYEGDIIKGKAGCMDYWKETADTVAVEWNECGAWYPFASDNDDAPYPPYPGGIEVIGNIYENGELLNG